MLRWRRPALSRALVIATLLITTILYVLVAAPLEGPDEAAFRLPRLLGQRTAGLSQSEEFVADFMAGVASKIGVDRSSIVHCSDSLPDNPRFAFGENKPLRLHTNQCSLRGYLALRVAFGLFLVVGFIVIFRSNMLLLASLALPSALFYATQISTDALNALLSIFGGYLALRRRPVALLFVAVAALANDKSAVALLAFALTILGCELVPSVRRLLSSRVGALAGLAIGGTIGVAVRALAGRLAALASFYATVLYNSHFSNNPIHQAGVLFLSSWYLGGSVAFTGFYIEYVAFAALLVCLYFAPRNWFAMPDPELKQVRFVISATVLVMTAIVAIIQPLTQARYYMFFAPAVVLAIAAAVRVRPSALVLAFAGLDIAYALSSAVDIS